MLQFLTLNLSFYTRMVANRRILALDVMRGITIVGMILFNTSSGYHYAPLNHAPWIGFTLADTAFPFFMFIVGITTWLSMKKYGAVPLSSEGMRHSMLLRKILMRTFSLVLVCWAFDLVGKWLFGLARGDCALDFSHLRYTGVLVRLGVCYGVCAIAALYVKLRNFPHVIIGLLLGYFVLLLLGQGFERIPENILGIVDRALIGEAHMCNDAGIDPEGILSTIPSVAHTMLGFWVGARFFGQFVQGEDNRLQGLLFLFVVGASLLLGGFLLSGVCPVSKKVWSPTFVMITCGAATLLLALLIYYIDMYGRARRIAGFFQVFGANPLVLYLFSEAVLWPMELIKVNSDGTDLWGYIFERILVPLFGYQGGDLAFALLNVALCWLLGYVLLRKKIYIKL